MLRDKRTIVQVANLAFAREISGKEMAVGGFTSLNGIPSLVSAVTVRDSSSKAHSNVALVAVRVLSTSALGALGRNYGITGLRPVMNSDMGIELRTPQGAVSSIRLVWQPARAGRIFFRKTLPIMFAIVILTLLAFMAVAFVAVRILTHAQAQEQRAQQAELDATEIRARAAEETARTKSAFIANMSHELRTPLNAIIGFSDMIRMETFGPVTNEKYRDYLNAINDSGKHLLDLVNDILQFSRIEAGKLSVRMEPLELEPLVRECVRITNGIALERNVRIECNRSGGPPMVLADRQATKQVLLNLLSNAVKFSPPDTAVTIDCRDVDESRHVIRICDQGCGIPAATLREIGKPFVQAEQTYSRKFQGTGLGLAICFLLASVMDAFIDIDSAQGEGTTVSVTFRKPVALNAVQAA
jgi:signal transduction histidine kinase